MAGPSYRRLQRAIARDDKHSVFSRWEYGRALLADPRRMSPTGKSLRHGVIESLIADATKTGSKLTEQEIQRRLRCARAYSTEAQIRHAMTDFETWFDLVQAGFPARQGTEETADPESELDRIEAGDRAQLELDLFPDMLPRTNLPLIYARMRDVEAYAAEMRRMTANYHRKDVERAEHLAALRAVVGDDPDVLYVVALAALRERTASL